jgi:putative NADH-flavin reductase
MRVFLTGATGFIGSFLVPELTNAGHHVVGLSHSDAGAEALTGAGAEVFRGDVNDLDRLRTAADAADGVIHAAFNHDFSKLKQHSEEDRAVIKALGEALAGSDRPLVITSGTGVARSKTGGPAVETDDHVTSAEFPRAASEEAADALIAKGGRVMVMRLPHLRRIHGTKEAKSEAQHGGYVSEGILPRKSRGALRQLSSGRVPEDVRIVVCSSVETRRRGHSGAPMRLRQASHEPGRTGARRVLPMRVRWIRDARIRSISHRSSRVGTRQRDSAATCFDVSSRSACAERELSDRPEDHSHR